MSSNIVHQYFKKEADGGKILLKVDPLRLQGIELSIPAKGEPAWRELEFSEDVDKELAAAGFQAIGPFEFNLYEAGLIGPETE